MQPPSRPPMFTRPPNFVKAPTKSKRRRERARLLEASVEASCTTIEERLTHNEHVAARKVKGDERAQRRHARQSHDRTGRHLPWPKAIAKRLPMPAPPRAPQGAGSTSFASKRQRGAGSATAGVSSSPSTAPSTPPRAKWAPPTAPSTQPAPPVYEGARQRNVYLTEGLGDFEPTEGRGAASAPAEDASRDAELEEKLQILARIRILADRLQEIGGQSG